MEKAFKAVAGRDDVRDDGPGVIREITAKKALERDAQLVGRLDPPAGTTLRIDASGTRIMSVNIHMAVPDGIAVNPPQHESIAALRDVACFINRVNPDVVLVQELRNRPVSSGNAGGNAGISDVAAVLAHLTGTSQMAFTPAITGNPQVNGFSHYGTAIYTRNGFTIERAVNVALPNAGAGTEPRSAGIAAISSPDGGMRLTVISTHLAHLPDEDRRLRSHQLQTLSAISASLRATGSFTYRDAPGGPEAGPRGGQEQKAEGFPRTIVLGGDLNQTQEATDSILNDAGFRHVNDLLAQQGGDNQTARAPTALGPNGPHRIDHLYGSDVEVLDVTVAPVPAREYTAGAPTDHKALIVDLKTKSTTRRAPQA